MTSEAEARLELRSIVEIMARTRGEIAALRPQLVRDPLPDADAELDAIVRDTEAATHTIMGAAEAMLACPAPTLTAYRRAVEVHSMIIFEACSFQDITGQRVSKLIAALRQVEDRVARLTEALAGQSGAPEPASAAGGEPLLNGPALHGPQTTQAEVDALFD